MGATHSSFVNKVHKIVKNENIFHYGNKSSCEGCGLMVHGSFNNWDEAIANPEFVSEIATNLMDDNYVIMVLCSGRNNSSANSSSSVVKGALDSTLSDYILTSEVNYFLSNFAISSSVTELWLTKTFHLYFSLGARGPCN